MNLELSMRTENLACGKRSTFQVILNNLFYKFLTKLLLRSFSQFLTSIKVSFFFFLKKDNRKQSHFHLVLDLVILFTLEFYNTPFYIIVLYPKTTILMKNHLSMQTTF